MGVGHPQLSFKRSFLTRGSSHTIVTEEPPPLQCRKGENSFTLYILIYYSYISFKKKKKKKSVFLTLWKKTSMIAFEKIQNIPVHFSCRRRGLQLDLTPARPLHPTRPLKGCVLSLTVHCGHGFLLAAHLLCSWGPHRLLVMQVVVMMVQTMPCWRRGWDPCGLLTWWRGCPEGTKAAWWRTCHRGNRTVAALQAFRGP